jgi:hypothetical protein
MLVHLPCNSLLTRQTLFDFSDAVHGSIAHIRNVHLCQNVKKKKYEI